MTVPKLRAAAVAFLVGLCLGLAVFATSRLFVRSVLEADARSAASELASRIGSGEPAEAGGKMSAILRYASFDRGGTMGNPTVLGSGSELPPLAGEKARQLADLAAQTGEAVAVQPPLLPSLFGLAAPGIRSAAAPLVSPDGPRGAVYVELDQSEAVDALVRAFTIASIAILGLAAVATLVTALAVTRRRQKSHAGEGGLGGARDALTDLPARSAFAALLAEGVKRAAATDQQLGLLVVDLNGMRIINDVWGHTIGDEVVKMAAARLGGLAQRPNVLGRISGDDFALMVEHDANSHALRRLANEIRDAVAAPYVVAGKTVTIGASIGAALYPVNAGTADLLFRAADSALSKAKKQGRNSLAFFDTDMERRMKRRIELEHDLKQALERNEFVVFYQPQLDLKSGKLRGYEALIRWERPGEGIVPPRDFLSVAEEMGLIGSIGEWVLRRACTDAAGWVESGTVAVNFSAAQIKAVEVDQMIAKTLAETQLPAERLEIEIPESLFLQPEPGVMETLRRIKALGVRIAMDDFGGGYSGLASLAHFPFDKIKIDRAFVTQLTEDADIAAIVASVVALGRLLSVDVTAEGVETADQVTLLRAAGCSTVQGFLFGVPKRAMESGSPDAGEAPADPAAENVTAALDIPQIMGATGA